MAPHPPSEILHASAVSLAGRAVLVLGPSGSGKSSLALDLMAFGAGLIADDRTRLTREGDRLIASAPEALPSKIEARGVGLLAAELAAPAPVAFAVDLGQIETARLPDWHGLQILGLTLPLVHKSENRSFPAAILQYLKGVRTD